MQHDSKVLMRTLIDFPQIDSIQFSGFELSTTQQDADCQEHG